MERGGRKGRSGEEIVGRNDGSLKEDNKRGDKGGRKRLKERLKKEDEGKKWRVRNGMRREKRNEKNKEA